MYVRFASYRIREDRNEEDWLVQHGDEVRSAPGVKEVNFLRNLDDEERIAALVYFETESDLQAYLSSDVFEEVVADLMANWVDPSDEVKQLQFEVVE